MTSASRTLHRKHRRLHPSRRPLRLEHLEDRVLLAAIPVMVDDLNTNTEAYSVYDSSDPVTIDGLTYFAADDGIHGQELWRTDGTEAGTWMVKNLPTPEYPGERSSLPTGFTNVNGRLYFYTQANNPGPQHLWVSDGTAIGTVELATFSEGYIGGLTPVGDRLYFAIADGGSQGELWVTDGTRDGTRMVKNLNPEYDSQYLDQRLASKVANVDGTLFFWAHDALNGIRLWKTDGTEANTVPVASVQTFSTTGNFQTSQTVLGNKLFFLGNPTGSTANRELWMSDGTSGGTVSLMNNPNINVFGELTAVNGVVYFVASNGATNTGRELWKSDGTTAGTIMVKDIRPGIGLNSDPSQLTNVNGTLYFSANDGTGSALWKSDGSEAGTIKVATAEVSDLTPVGSTLYFRNFDPTFETQLWKADGSGISLVTDIRPTISDSINQIVSIGDRVIFRANDGKTGQEHWISDGTAAGTYLVKDINTVSLPSGPFGFVELDGNTVFWADDGIHGREPFVTDGTTGGSQLLADTNPGLREGYASSQNFVRLGNKILFEAVGPGGLMRLWETDGTPAGTQVVTDSLTSQATLSPSVNGRVFFAASDAEHGMELWSTDGTAAGTDLFMDLVPGSDASQPYVFVAANGRLYFQARTGTNQQVQYWVTDGTTENTRVLTTNSAIGYQSLVPVGTSILYVAADVAHGPEVWIQNPATGVEQRLTDLDSAYGPTNPTEVDGRVYFFARTGVNQEDLELWSSDGTPQGTARVQTIKDNVPLPAESMVLDTRSFGGQLYFVVATATYDNNNESYEYSDVQLWRSNGATPGGTTTLVHTFDPSWAWFGNFIASNGQLFFSAYDSAAGVELWTTDGVSAARYADLAPGTLSSWPGSGAFNETSFFSANNGVSGSELWRMLNDQDPSVLPSVNIPAGGGTIIVERQSNDLVVKIGATELLRRPLGSLAGLTINGDTTSEIFIVNIDGLSAAQLPRGITINAGEGTGDNDTLVLSGTTTISNFDYTTGGPEAGTLTLDGFTVNFTQFEPIIDQLNVTDRTFHIGTAGSQTIVLGAGTDAGMSKIDDSGSGDFESLSFKSPTGTLAVDAGDGDDTIIIATLDPTFGAVLSVAGGAGNDVLDASNYVLPIILAGGPGNDELTGGSGNDSLDGGAGQDLLDGGAGADIVQVDPAHDTIVTDPNDEVITPPPPLNSPPTAAVGNQQCTETELTAQVVASDPDVGDSLTYAVSFESKSGPSTLNDPTGFSIDSSGLFHWTPGGGQLGQYTFKAKVTDSGGLFTEQTLVVTTLGLVDGVLTIVGTSGVDKIDVKPTDGDPDDLTVKINEKDYHYKLKPQNNPDNPYSGVTLIHVCGLSGDDQITIQNTVAISSWLEGGAGNDQLHGGAGDDVILGGSGVDEIFGGDGNDMLIGGLGADKIKGEKGNDILVSGDVAGDLDFATLRAISQAWASSRSVADDTVDDLLDETVGDANSDSLTGGAGADLFIINTGDTITDFTFGKPKSNKDGDAVIKNGLLTT